MKRFLGIFISLFMMISVFSSIAFADEEAVLDFISVDEKNLENFDSSSSLRDYYYGMDELPETIEKLPVVSASGNGTVTVKNDYELGGYISEITVKTQDTTDVWRLHFRELKTLVLSPKTINNIRWANHPDLGYEGSDQFADCSPETFVYYEFDTSSISDINIQGAALKVFTKYNIANNYYVGNSNYTSVDELLSKLSIGNKDFKGGPTGVNFDVISKFESVNNGAYNLLELDPQKIRIKDNKIVLVIGKDENGTNSTYFYNSAGRYPSLEMTYVESEISFDKDFSVTKVEYTDENGNEFDTFRENMGVNVSFKIKPSKSCDTARPYCVIVLLSNNGRIVDSEFEYKILMPDASEEADGTVDLSLELTEEPFNTTVAVYVWDDPLDMNPLVCESIKF